MQPLRRYNVCIQNWILNGLLKMCCLNQEATMALLGVEGRQWLVLRAQNTFKCHHILKIPISVLFLESHSFSFMNLSIEGSTRVQE